jgi:ketosteroid isomerase-like protein
MVSPNELRNRLLAAVDRKDLAEITDCYHEDAVLIAPEGRFEGRDYVEAYFRIQFDGFPDTRLSVSSTHDSDNIGIAEWTFTGTNTGPLELPGNGTVPATGKRVSQRGADICVLDGNRIREHRLYYDQLELVEQLQLQSLAKG